MPIKVRKFTLVANTNTQVLVGGNNSPTVRLTYVPVASEPAVVAGNAADLTAGNGFPITQAGPWNSDSLELAPGESVWVRSTAAGVLHVLET